MTEERWTEASDTWWKRLYRRLRGRANYSSVQGFSQSTTMQDAEFSGNVPMIIRRNTWWQRLIVRLRYGRQMAAIYKDCEYLTGPPSDSIGCDFHFDDNTVPHTWVDPPKDSDHGE